MLTLLRCELLKMRRTPIGLIVVAAPLAVAAIAVLMALRQQQPAGLLSNALGLWVVLVLPMSAATVTAFLAQIEHAPRAFDHLFTLPMRRSRLFLAKAAIALGLLAAMTAWLVGSTVLLGIALVDPATAVDGITAAIADGALILAAAGALCMLQLWIALRSRSFVVPLTIGILGSFVAAASLGTAWSAFMPWGAPMAVLASGGGHVAQGVAVGVLGGVVFLCGMLLHLSHAELNG